MSLWLLILWKSVFFSPFCWCFGLGTGWKTLDVTYISIYPPGVWTLRSTGPWLSNGRCQSDTRPSGIDIRRAERFSCIRFDGASSPLWLPLRIWRLSIGFAGLSNLCLKTWWWARWGFDHHDGQCGIKLLFYPLHFRRKIGSSKMNENMIALYMKCYENWWSQLQLIRASFLSLANEITAGCRIKGQKLKAKSGLAPTLRLLAAKSYLLEIVLSNTHLKQENTTKL